MSVNAHVDITSFTASEAWRDDFSHYIIQALIVRLWSVFLKFPIALGHNHTYLLQINF